MKRENLHFFFLNIGHFLDHLFVLIFATAVLKLALDWNMSYAELLPYATPGMVAFGLGAIPAGWIADKWRRDGMMQVFFVGIGVASIACSFATIPTEMAIGLFRRYLPTGWNRSGGTRSGQDQYAAGRQRHLWQSGCRCRTASDRCHSQSLRLEMGVHHSRRLLHCNRHRVFVLLES